MTNYLPTVSDLVSVLLDAGERDLAAMVANYSSIADVESEVWTDTERRAIDWALENLGVG